MRRSGRSASLTVLALAILGLVVVSATVSSAQLGVFPTPTPHPRTPTPAPSAPATTPPSGTTAPTSRPVPSVVVPGEPSATPKGPDRTSKPGETREPKGEDEGELPESLEDFDIPSFVRTRARNTVALVKILRGATEFGMPLEQALIEGMGRFPVAGLAHYSDDWMNPRFTPKPHLHEGLDIFADFGTPIRSPDEGVVTQLSTHGAGGIAVWTRGSDGTSYYFAHLLEVAEGLRVGQRVEVGTVLGTVGDSGNAKGGTPHLHFEIHPNGGEAVPPKPTVDAWLDEAEKLAPGWVDSRRAEVRSKGRIIASSTVQDAAEEEIEASMLLTALDPVGGSVGLLPRLQVQPRRSGGAISDRLLTELIQRRVAGHLFIPSSARRLAD